MKKIIMFLTTLILVLSCGTSDQNSGDINKSKLQGTDIENLQEIDEKVYKYVEERPYSGKIIIKDENDKIVMIETAKDGKIEGEVRTYYETGKLKEKYLKQGIDEYAKRLGSYCKLQLVEVPDEKAPEK